MSVLLLHQPAPSDELNWRSISEDIVAYLLKARTVEPEKQPLLANGSETTAVSKERFGKHFPEATDTYATIEVLLERVFSTRSVQRGYKEDSWQPTQFCTGGCEEKRQLKGSRPSERA
jgi:hypothetical protein